MANERKQTYGGPAVRHYRRKNTLNLYLTVASGVLAALVTLLSVNVFFNLSPMGLTINGCTLYSAEQIQHIGGLVPGQNLVRLNTVYIQQRLKDNLVYIEDVQVVKEYPNSLRIDIIEAVPKAQLEHEGTYCTVSESGRLLEVGEPERNKKLPLVVGYEPVPYKNPEEDSESDSSDSSGVKVVEMSGTQLRPGDPAVSADPQKEEILEALFKEIKELDFKKIRKIDITDRTDIKLIYDNRIQIELGSSVDLDIKLLWIKSVIDRELPEGYEGTLRYNGIDSGISAIAKQEEVPVYTPKKTDSSADDSEAEDTAGEGGENGDETSSDSSSAADEGGYTDPGSYTYTDPGSYDYTDPNGYDYGYDQGYGYDDGGYTYDDGGYGYDDGGYGYDQGQTW